MDTFKMKNLLSHHLTAVIKTRLKVLCVTSPIWVVDDLLREVRVTWGAKSPGSTSARAPSPSCGARTKKGSFSPVTSMRLTAWHTSLVINQLVSRHSVKGGSSELQTELCTYELTINCIFKLWRKLKWVASGWESYVANSIRRTLNPNNSVIKSSYKSFGMR